MELRTPVSDAALVGATERLRALLDGDLVLELAAPLDETRARVEELERIRQAARQVNERLLVPFYAMVYGLVPAPLALGLAATGFVGWWALWAALGLTAIVYAVAWRRLTRDAALTRDLPDLCAQRLELARALLDLPGAPAPDSVVELRLDLGDLWRPPCRDGEPEDKGEWRVTRYRATLASRSVAFADGRALETRVQWIGRRKLHRHEGRQKEEVSTRMTTRARPAGAGDLAPAARRASPRVAAAQGVSLEGVEARGDWLEARQEADGGWLEAFALREERQAVLRALRAAEEALLDVLRDPGREED